MSTYSGGQGVGNLVGGYLGDKLGRKKTIWLAASLALVGAILQTAAVSISMFLVGRILAGFAVGLVYAISSIYNAEIAPPKIRGVLVGLQTQVSFILLAFLIVLFHAYLGFQMLISRESSSPSATRHQTGSVPSDPSPKSTQHGERPWAFSACPQ